MIHFLPRELKTRFEVYGLEKPDRRCYMELFTACGRKITKQGYARRGWTITSNAEETTCGRCKITIAWRSEIRSLVRRGVIEELPRYIP